MIRLTVRPHHQAVRGCDRDDSAYPVLVHVLSHQESEGGSALPRRGSRSGAGKVRTVFFALYYHVFGAFGAAFSCCIRCYYCLLLPPPATKQFYYHESPTLSCRKASPLQCFPSVRLAISIAAAVDLFCCTTYPARVSNYNTPNARTSLVFSINADDKRQTALLLSAPSSCRHSYA